MNTGTKQLIRFAATVYIDASSLMSDKLVSFLESLEEDAGKIIIPSSTYSQLVKWSQEASPKGALARDALEICDERYRDYFRVEQTPEKPARFFIGKAKSRNTGAPILVISQGSDLAYALNQCRDRGCKVLVKRLAFGGNLSNFDLTKLPVKMNSLSQKTNAAAVLKTLL